MKIKFKVSFRHRKIRNLLKGAIIFGQLVALSQAGAVEADKVSHFAGGAAAGLAVDTALYHLATGVDGPATRMATATGLALIPGLIIEVVDEFSPKTSFSWTDFLADGLGAVTGAVAAELINGQLWISASGRQIRLIGRW